MPPAEESQWCEPSRQGCGVGAGVGAAVGTAVGTDVGVAVGIAVGECVGLGVGAGVGLAVGEGVGLGVGAAVSSSVIFTRTRTTGNICSLAHELLLCCSTRSRPMGSRLASAQKIPVISS